MRMSDWSSDVCSSDLEIILEGRDLLRASERELIQIRRHKMGMVFQHFALLPHLTVLQNVAFPLEVQGAGRAQRDARAREVIELEIGRASCRERGCQCV